MDDPGCNGSLKSAAYYVNFWNYQAANDLPRSIKETAKMGAVGPDWQLAGPFENLSGSGYYKEFGPLQHPEGSAIFKSAASADISWFSPAAMCRDGWAFPFAHIRYSTAVVYAQTFVESSSDRKILLNAGCNGAIRVWVNDEEVVTEKKEYVTELDYYKNYARLKKGFNRILVQLSYTGNSSPNFIIRLTDDNYNPAEGLSYSSAYHPYPRQSSAHPAPASIKHFAEAFFENRIKKDPENLINYILLCKTYLRDGRSAEARTLMEDKVKAFPDNALLRFELMQCYIKEGSRTLLLQETERMKEKDPECLLAFRLNIQELMNNEKYSEAADEINKYISIFGDAADEDMLNTRVKLYGAQNKTEELIKLIEDTYKKDPENVTAAELMFNVKMKVYKDVKGAFDILEKYLKNNFNYQLIKKIAEEYGNQGMTDKELQWRKYLAGNFAYDGDLVTDISKFYFDQKNYSKAAEYGRQALSLAPYVANYWENLGVELKQQNADKEAIEAYRKAIYYDPNKYRAREQLRELEKKSSLLKAFPETDVYELIKHTEKNIVDHDYAYLLDEKFAVIYPEGASEEYYTMVVSIVNQKGIDAWKETSISYNSNSSYLVIEKAETVKKNGVKTPAEQNDNQLVFTGLEAGDALVLKYKIQNYAQGRLAKEYWNKFIFNAFVPEKISRFCLLAANNIKVSYKALNTSLDPKISQYDDFTLYTWQKDSSDAFKRESYMPAFGDVGASVSVSTIASWKDIAEWYSDLSSLKTEDDFEVRRVFSELFPKGTGGMSQKNIAHTIYDYIEDNIRYSSVAFRQSAYVPQKPSVTINTGLGDCKDLSALFVSLAQLAGIKANLVLVNTRDNGQKSMILPSVEFNHCIVKATLDSRPWYIELTDNDLPFGSLPSSLYQATSLVIPSASGEAVGNAALEEINAVTRTKERLKRKTTVSFDGNDMKLKTQVTKTGALTSSPRDQFAMLSSQKQVEEMEKNLSGRYKNPVKVTSVTFTGLDEKTDSLTYTCNYTVQNEVSELGDIQMIKIPFEDVVATVDNFSPSERVFPVEYWRYEDVDEYETIIDIQAPAGRHFIEVPKDEKFTFPGGTYTLQYVKRSPDKLTVIRKASLKRNNIPPSEYTVMKDFLNKIVKAESKYIAFKK
jgi:tetratricopeptide (TPR) repeat protein